jgi:3-methyladenine DNA glycosylase AlkD
MVISPATVTDELGISSQWMLRAAGATERQRLLAFLDKHAGRMPRTALRYVIEHLDKNQREHYLRLKQG